MLMAKAVKQAPVARCEVIILGQVDEPSFMHGSCSPEDIKRVDKAAEEVRKILGDSIRFMVYSSLDPASMGTASAFLWNSWVRDHSLRDVAPRTHALNDDAFEQGLVKDPRNRFLAELKAMADGSIREAETDAGMVLVASPDFITEFPEKTGFGYAEPPHAEALGINHLALESTLA